MTKELIPFDAEIGKILHLVIHSLYTNKDIFLRELVSNASDACDKLRYLSQTNPDLLKENSELKINISLDEAKRTITIKDNGIGMNKQDLIENLGTIARSGTQRFLEQLSSDKSQNMALIGQFGVGFYSAYMVADNVTVITRKAGEEQGWIWSSSGDSAFAIEANSDTTPRGTTIILHLKEGEDDYLDKFRIKHIIQTYSDHISIPIEFLDSEGNIEVFNQASALWARPKSEITEEQYQEFYKHIAHSPDQPWMILHNKNEGMVSFTNLLFIPSRKPFDLFHPDRKTRVKLYVKRIFITEDTTNIVPSYLRFVRGIVDSEDLPLNISRETLQHNNIVERIKKSIVKKILSELKKKLEDDFTSYLEFWNNFGAVIKEGLCEGLENKENILEICLFRSALTGEMITLKKYIDNYKADQEHIYYYLTDEKDIAKLQNSPQLEGFIKKGIDVLLFSDQVDDFWVNVEHQFMEKELKSVTRSDISLDKIAGQEDQQAEDKEEDHKPDNEALIEFFKSTLGNLVRDVKISRKLIESPVCLTVAEGAMDIRMERFLIGQKQLSTASAKILEINPNHALIKNIAGKLEHKDESVEELIKLLYDQACIIEGEPVVNATDFSKRLNKFLVANIA
jgi:molecular chaperone HtpG